MEDRHTVMLDIAGEPTQAFFAVIDGHGGHAAGENGGAFAAGVLLKNRELYTTDVGDSKAVLSMKGNAITLTNNHHLTTREDELARIENSGGFLYFHNGVFRVNGSIDVSRAFGDIHLKDWIISEPEIMKLPLT
ncbi:probable phosphatase 2C 2, partial [Olea europaea subsp. europaea]